LAFNFNDDPETLTVEPAAPSASSQKPSEPPAQPAPTGSETSAAFVRFRSCRWHQPPENGSAEFCTHREVKPYAGTTGFDADAWCPDCQYYKLRRAPRKRQNDDMSY
jgi:hypothetical protein